VRLSAGNSPCLQRCNLMHTVCRYEWTSGGGAGLPGPAMQHLELVQHVSLAPERFSPWPLRLALCGSFSCPNFVVLGKLRVSVFAPEATAKRAYRMVVRGDMPRVLALLQAERQTAAVSTPDTAAWQQRVIGMAIVQCLRQVCSSCRARHMPLLRLHAPCLWCHCCRGMPAALRGFCHSGCAVLHSVSCYRAPARVQGVWMRALQFFELAQREYVHPSQLLSAVLPALLAPSTSPAAKRLRETARSSLEAAVQAEAPLQQPDICHSFLELFDGPPAPLMSSLVARQRSRRARLADIHSHVRAPGSISSAAVCKCMRLCSGPV
jgi:hypothetical protein